VKCNKDGTVKDGSLNAACGGIFCDYRAATMGCFSISLERHRFWTFCHDEWMLSKPKEMIKIVDW